MVGRPQVPLGDTIPGKEINLGSSFLRIKEVDIDLLYSLI